MDAYQSGETLPVGSQIALLLDSEDAPGAVTTLWMEKESDGWHFAVERPDGLREDEYEPACRRCHEEAPHDLVFRIALDPSWGAAAGSAGGAAGAAGSPYSGNHMRRLPSAVLAPSE